MELLEVVEKRALQGLKERIKASNAVLRGGKGGESDGSAVSDFLRSEAWVMRMALERLGVIEVLGSLREDELEV